MRICCDNCKKCKPESVKPYTLNVPDEVYLCDECFKALMGSWKKEGLK